MEYAQTIAMARNLLADGRAEDVVRMVEPVLETAEDAAPSARAALQALLGRVHAVHTGDIDRALTLLADFEEASSRLALPPSVRGPVTLWLGWAHARHDETFDEEARALNLLEEAHQGFASELDESGQCWALLGRAQAYFTIDEYQLMRQALDEAAPLQRTMGDVQAERWFHELSIAARRFQGRYQEAQRHVDALTAWADRAADREVEGRAHAYQAALYVDQGYPPERIIDTAERAQALLCCAPQHVGYPLLVAYHAHIRALLLRGDWEDVDPVIESARSKVSTPPIAPMHLDTLRVRRALRQQQPDRAAQLLDHVLDQLPHLPHGFQRSRVALLRGQLLAFHGQYADAQSWIRRAYRNARETGHRGRQLHALLSLVDAALDADDSDTVDRTFEEIDQYDDYFSVLPFAAYRFELMGRRAHRDGRLDDARTAINQALSAYRMIGDARRTAKMQHTLASLLDDRPSQARALLTAAADTFERLGAHDDAEAARRLRAATPAPEDAAPLPVESTVGAALARASVSVRLVAEAWIQAAEALLPGRWIGVYRCTADDGWSCIHEHGVPPADLAPPSTATGLDEANGVLWKPLYNDDAACIYMAVATQEDAPAWREAAARLAPWFPVAQLALERALLREQSIEDASTPEGASDVLPEVDGFVHDSAPLRSIAQRIQRVRASHSPVLIAGETGVGKTTIARVIHATSERRSGPWHVINCASVPPDSLDARLFGTADGDSGLLHQADGGSLLLQEIGELPRTLQAKLLQVLEAESIVSSAAPEPRRVDVRVLASTTEDLSARVRAERFRDDLYYRLNVISLHVPPLRERRADIPALVRHFATTLPPAGTPPVSITNRALETLVQYDWPGNVRQLRNEIERALLFVTSEPAPTIDLNVLSDSVRADAAPPDEHHDDWAAIMRPDLDLNDMLARTEKDIIERVLTECDGQITASADMLGLTRQGLYKKMKRLAIDPANFKPSAMPSALAS